MSDPKDVFKQVLEDELRKIAPGASTEPHIERPKNPEHGDLSTNVALQLAKSLGLKPRDIAQKLLKGTEAALIEKGITTPGGVSIAGPGFLNVRVSTGSKLAQIAEALKLGREYGNARTLATEKSRSNSFPRTPPAHSTLVTAGRRLSATPSRGCWSRKVRA